MTKKDYELIAAAIKRTVDEARAYEHPAYGLSIRLSALEDLANDLAGELTKTNPRFDQRRFLVACGVLPEGGDA